MKLGIITMLIHNKDDIQFVTESPCFLGHPVSNIKFYLDLKREPILDERMIDKDNPRPILTQM